MHFLSKGFQGLLFSQGELGGQWEVKGNHQKQNKYGGNGTQVAIETRSVKIHMWKSIILKTFRKIRRITTTFPCLDVKSFDLSQKLEEETPTTVTAK